jgi:hypothetical protein
MWLAAFRRLGLLIVFCLAAIALGALVFGVLLGSSFARSFSLGLYLVGAFLMLAGFFVGNRGPARVRSESAGSAMLPFPLFGGSRRLRWASPGEQDETINQSAVFVALGLILVFVGVAVDPRYPLF